MRWPTYGLVGVGGTQLQPLTLAPARRRRDPAAERRSSQRGFGSVLGDVFTNAYPAWTFGVQIGYPLGTSIIGSQPGQGAPAGTRRPQTQLRNLELADRHRRSATPAARCRPIVSASTRPRVARELAERRLDAEEKKFAAGIQTSFFVFQAQRDLAQARTNEVKAILGLQQVAGRLRSRPGSASDDQRA